MARTVGSSGEKTAAAIRAAATELIALHGYEGVSLRGLADAVGVQSASLYRYFASKQDLLCDLMEAHMTDLLSAWQAQPASEDARATLIAFVRFHLAYHIDKRDAVFLSYMELRSLSPENHARVSELRRRYEIILRDILARGAAEGVFRVDDAAVAGMAIIGMLTGVTVWYRPKGRLSRERVIDIYTGLVLGAVGAV